MERILEKELYDTLGYYHKSEEYIRAYFTKEEADKILIGLRADTLIKIDNILSKKI